MRPKSRTKPASAATTTTEAVDLQRLAGVELVENPARYDTMRALSAGDDQPFAPDVAERALAECGSGEDLSLGGAMSVPALQAAPSAAPCTASDAAAHLTLSAANLARVRELRAAFADAGDDSTIGERLLEDLTAMEAGIALSLLDTEAAAVALLQRTLTVDAALAVKVAQLGREIVDMSSAVRRRMQNALAAAAGLRAQRRFISAQRGAHGK